MRQDGSEHDPAARADGATNGESSAPSGATSLYRWWFDALPAFFGIDGARMAENAAGTAADGGAATAEEPAQMPFPIDCIADSLALTGELLNALYGGYFKALAAGRAEDATGAFAHLVEEQLATARARLARPAEAARLAAQAAAADVAALGLRMHDSSMHDSSAHDSSAHGPTSVAARLNPLGEMLRPIALTVDWAYGGLFDALGLVSVRAFQSVLREMAQAAVEHQRAQAGYLEEVSGALARGGESALTRLRQMRDQGESVDSMAALVRLWAQATDQAMHAAMQSPRALESAAAVVRTAARWRHQQQRVVAIASEALNVPTRAELDDAFREIQDLKRGLRRLRKNGALADDTVRANDAVRADDGARSGDGPRANGKTRAKGQARARGETRAKGDTRAEGQTRAKGQARAKGEIRTKGDVRAAAMAGRTPSQRGPAARSGKRAARAVWPGR